MTTLRDQNSGYNYSEESNSINQHIIRQSEIANNKWMLWASWFFVAALPIGAIALVSYLLFIR
ncbi:MAG: hypothetical protein CMO01_31630 [Thalassobius sp.]|nr:hypothetical protein [Thalassovita sp.]|tara:strand:+ start:284 stop:472 length:189 start_codon:yes stop_codon:yes gene_type:complete